MVEFDVRNFCSAKIFVQFGKMVLFFVFYIFWLLKKERREETVENAALKK